MVTILFVDHDLPENDYKFLLRLVSDEKQSRIKRFHFYKDAQNALLSDILARFLIGKRTGLTNRQLQFSANAYGKPFLVNDTRVQYNLSHSGNYIAFAIDSEPVGIDIELIEPIDLKIADRFFSNDETAYIKSRAEEMRITAFYEIWTKKESRIKLEGKGLSIPLTGFSVLNQTAGGFLYYNMLEDRSGVMCHVCTTKKEKPPCCIMNASEFVSFYLGL